MFQTGIVAQTVNEDHGLMDGDVINGPASIVHAMNNGHAVLPFDPDHPLGYTRRGAGHSLRVTSPGGENVCPLVVQLVPERPWLYWCALVNGIGPVRAQVVAEASTMSATVSGDGGTLVELRGRPMFLYGRRRVSAVEPTFATLKLRVAGRDIAVQVFAVSQSRIDVAYP